MEKNIQNYLTSIRLGDPQVHQNIILFPLHAPANGSPDYVTLGDALKSNTLTVTEVSQAGSVPELLVVNKGDQAVLLLDGEELVGAKQNRVLNTTILLREKSETKIPVTCTEHGRWSYSSPQFAAADVIMEKNVRARKSRSVSESLASAASYLADQGEVWEQISELHAKAQTHSPTGAMNDVFKARGEDLRKCLETFPLAPGQQGLLVLINGDVAGFDLISRPDPYAKLHHKLVRSYVLDGLIDSRPAAGGTAEAKDKAQRFLEEITRARQTKFQSLGYGWDFRFQADGLVGNALLHEEHVIHAAFFQLRPAEHREGMASLRQRRHHLYGRGNPSLRESWDEFGIY